MAMTETLPQKLRSRRDQDKYRDQATAGVMSDAADAIVHLTRALKAAPRPKPGAEADWMVLYMDWFFQTRIQALGANGQQAAVKEE